MVEFSFGVINRNRMKWTPGCISSWHKSQHRSFPSPLALLGAFHEDDEWRAGKIKEVPVKLKLHTCMCLWMVAIPTVSTKNPNRDQWKQVLWYRCPEWRNPFRVASDAFFQPAVQYVYEIQPNFPPFGFSRITEDTLQNCSFGFEMIL